MRYLIIFLTTFVFNVYANDRGDWRDLENIQSSNTYATKSICTKKTGNKCGRCQDTRKCKKGLVDNPNDPKYTKQDIATCTDRDSCQPLLEALDCSQYAKGTFPVMVQDFSEVYCAQPNGFNKMDGIVPDPVGIAQVDSEEATKRSEKTAKKTKRNSRLSALESCAKLKIADMTASKQKNCTRAIARELVRNRLKASEL